MEEKNWPVRTVLTLVLIAAAGLFGWWWKDQIQVQKVNIEGLVHAEEEVVRQMIRVDSTLLFFQLDPLMIADRVRRHPWIEDAEVQRYPNATLQIRVTERTPAVLVVDASGTPERYLDAAGFQMPFLQGAVYDVPLLSGLAEPMHPTRPVTHPALLSLLQDISTVPDRVDALISAFELEEDGQISMFTTPKPGRGSIQVSLGRDHFDERLSRLYAFWHKAILAKEDVDFASIDLRFDSQIITQENRLSQ